MKGLRKLLATIRADFLERSRRYSFLITLGVMIYLGYLAVPAADSRLITLDLGGIRGVYNSAWIGSMTALLSTMIFSLPGFYLVKGVISRDRRTGVGKILAAASLRKISYIGGKVLSNQIYLAVITALILMAAAGMQLVRGELISINLWNLIAPYLFLTLPVMLLVAAAAVWFETVPVLKQGFGNLVYFFLWLTAIIISLSGVTFGPLGDIQKIINDPFGVSRVGYSMHQAARSAYPGRYLDFGIGYTKLETTVDTFLWSGMDWTLAVAADRLVWVGAALLITVGAAVFFDCFDPSQEQDSRGSRISFFDKLREKIPRISIPAFRPNFLQIEKLPGIIRLTAAELKMALFDQPWWWFLGAVGLLLGGVFSSDYPSLQGVWIATWIWPVLVWSKFGLRERKYRTGAVVFSSPGPLRKLFPAQWLAAVLITGVTGAGVALKLILLGRSLHLLGWLMGVIFISTLALSLGVLSGSSKTFEAFYVVIWYLGPVSGLTEVDFFGVTKSAVMAGIPFYYLGISGLLLAASYINRWMTLNQ